MKQTKDFNVDQKRGDTILLTTDVIRAYATHNAVTPDDLPGLIRAVHDALAGLGSEGSAAADVDEVAKATPAQVRGSITPDALISFIDGRPYKMLKRHLRAHGLTIEAYRARYGLPADYPSTASTYSQARSIAAKFGGLGRNRRKASGKTAHRTK